MKLAYIDLCGFRGYRNAVKMEFADGFTVIDGRNGVGKSTIFDCVEFALTGHISKYKGATASGETVADYIWWKGEAPAPDQRYVEIGFRDGDNLHVIRRTPISEPDAKNLKNLASKLCDQTIAPENAIGQLCASSIIRDELITDLSLDLSETERFALLRGALGANDADQWIDRGKRLDTLAKQRINTAQQEVAVANANAAATARRIDEVRAAVVSESVISQAVKQLQSFANSLVSPDQLSGPVRERIAQCAAEIDSLGQLVERWEEVGVQRLRLDSLRQAVEVASAEKDSVAALLDGLKPRDSDAVVAVNADEVRAIVALTEAGRQLGLRDGHCPLCSQAQTPEAFEEGVRAAEKLAEKLNANAAIGAQRELNRKAAEGKLATATKNWDAAKTAYSAALNFVENFDKNLQTTLSGQHSSIDLLKARLMQTRLQVEVAQGNLRILDTLKLNNDFERALRANAEAKERVAKSQERFGRTRKAGAAAQALYDAARRSASETLDLRLERVLPLMSELFGRLRPHPVWSEIEYSIRGDVRRFLKLQVGDQLNPQFLFSSGQRRATGLAFLLSVNLSLAWNRWKTILLDDPVQHVDDFRAVHLAELMAQLVAEGRQIICSVEDAALADLLCRRLPVENACSAKRITLGTKPDGDLGKLEDHFLALLPRQSVITKPAKLAAP